MGTRTKRAFAIMASFVLLAAACPNNDDDGPLATEAPAPAGTPTETEPPADTGPPTDTPTETAAPAETEPPLATEAPPATEAPAETDVPTTTEAPATSEPTAIDALFEYGIDNADGQFIETDSADPAVEVVDVSIEVGDRTQLTATVTSPDASPFGRITFFAATDDGGNLNFTCSTISDGDGGTVERNDARLFRGNDVPIEQAPPGCDPTGRFSITMPIACVAGALSATVVDETGGEIVLPVAPEYALEIASGDIVDGTSAVYRLDLGSTAICSA